MASHRVLYNHPVNQSLKQFQIKDGGERRVAACRKLPRKLRNIALPFVTSSFWFAPGDRDQQKFQRAQERFLKLSDRDRLKIFAAFFPHFGPVVQAAWDLQRALPYQLGYARKAFRAPHDPERVQARQLGWLRSLLMLTEDFLEQDLVWHATWSGYMPWGNLDVLGLLFAAAINEGDAQGQAIFEILRATAAGEHPVGKMGRHVTSALLTASKPAGWEVIERLLLAAQRQEGLRQTIVETVDLAHPEAFRRMLALITDHDLLRFSSVLRAVDVWFGLGWDVTGQKEARRALELAARFLVDPAERKMALEEGDPESIYLALWSLGITDVRLALPLAGALLAHPAPMRRFAGIHFLAETGLTSDSEGYLLHALADEDWHVVARGLQFLDRLPKVETQLAESVYERLEAILARLSTKTKTLKPIVWPWMALTIERKQITRLLTRFIGARSPLQLLSHLADMDAGIRGVVVGQLAKYDRQPAEVRAALLQLTADRSHYVRKSVFEALDTHLKRRPLKDEEAQAQEDLLARKASDLRRGVLTLLLSQDDRGALASAERLLAADSQPVRLGGLDLLHEMIEGGRSVEKSRALAAEFKRMRKPLGQTETGILTRILGDTPQTLSLEEGLGLYDPTDRTPPTVPQSQAHLLQANKSLVSQAAWENIKSLDAWVHAHRNQNVTLQTWEGEQEQLLGNLTWNFPQVAAPRSAGNRPQALPTPELWEAWLEARDPSLRDPDGMELLRALGVFTVLPLRQFWFTGKEPVWVGKLRRKLAGNLDLSVLRYSRILHGVLGWQLLLHPPAEAVDFLLDAVEHSLAGVPPRERGKVVELPYGRVQTWRDYRVPLGWLQLARLHRALRPDEWEPRQHVRLWRLLRWIDEPAPEMPRVRPWFDEIIPAYEAGEASEADLYDHLLSSGVPNPYLAQGNMLWALSSRRPHPLLQGHPWLADLVTRVRDRVLEIELARGVMPTPASALALHLGHSGGLERLVPLLQALGREHFIRGWTFDSQSRAAVFSALIRRTFPGEEETLAQFAEQVQTARIPETWLVELAVYAPQWAGQVEAALGWEGLEEASWWLHAHTKGHNWTVPQEVREAWGADTSRRTPLTAEELMDGAVDVAWFRRTYAPLGAERWEALYKAARYTSGGSGHQRARLFADAMLGSLELEALKTRILKKRYQDAVRALGLIPLPEGEAREPALMERYATIQEFLVGSRKFGAQRRASEKLAAEIGLANLARSAGYPDAQRLTWALEAEALSELADGPVRAELGEVAVTLSIDPLGEAQLEVIKKGRVLKNIPRAVKKDPAIERLLELRNQVKGQTSRMRRSLEQSMVRGDDFSPQELRALLAHPVLAPMLTRLVFIGEGLAGFPSPDGSGLEGLEGELGSLAADAALRIAHPQDLLVNGNWHAWQRICFAQERVQPFKQVFRELYPRTALESGEETRSPRYAGQQVNPRQGLALLGTRGWVNQPGEGIFKTYHAAGILTTLEIQGLTFTPADVEGLTLEGVRFYRRSAPRPMKLADVPERLFSETMRDLDLVVSVAHIGGVDPEASHSTVEMRADLVRETCTLLGLQNVTLQKSWALVEGELASYNVHLGSAVVHIQPGGALCIVPVHSQHRGRLFLPFADDDPRTAEVVSKVLLLAEDGAIQDPTILAQILPRA